MGRGERPGRWARSSIRDRPPQKLDSLGPSDGERVRERGCIHLAAWENSILRIVCRLEHSGRRGRSADCKSAIQQTESLRYSDGRHAKYLRDESRDYHPRRSCNRTDSHTKILYLPPKQSQRNLATLAARDLQERGPPSPRVFCLFQLFGSRTQQSALLQ